MSFAGRAVVKIMADESPVDPETKFSKVCLEFASETVDKIINHPFNEGLIDGSLDLDTFKHFIQQDTLYLVDYARALLVIGSKAQEVEVMEKLIYFAQETLTTEKDMHKHYFELYNLQPTDRKAFSTAGYGNFLITTASQRPVHEALAAMFPCFVVFYLVGQHVAKNATIENNPYKEWIDLYTSEWMDSNLDKMSTIVDEAYQSQGPTERQQMLVMFREAVRFELGFWEGVYKRDSVLGEL
jgi:thiaminase/transcriptional activator TenA